MERRAPILITVLAIAAGAWLPLRGAAQSESGGGEKPRAETRRPVANAREREAARRIASKLAALHDHAEKRAEAHPLDLCPGALTNGSAESAQNADSPDGGTAAGDSKTDSKAASTGDAKADSKTDSKTAQNGDGENEDRGPRARGCGGCFEHLISEYFDLRDRPAPPDLAAGLGRCKSALQLSFLTATVPDPVDSALGYQFDRTVESLERALEAAGYVRDRYWLPWRAANTEDSDDTTNSAAPAAQADAPATADANDDSSTNCRLHSCQSREPGVIVFRRTQPTPALMILFLVGETPTMGLQKPALARVLDFLAAAGERHVQLVGPMFSGTTPSLIATIRDWTAASHQKLKYTLISGAATARTNLDLIERFNEEPRETPIEIHFAATVLPDDVVEREFYRYLQRLMWLRESWPRAVDQQADCTLDDVAMLVESNTAYGSGILAANRKPGAKSDSSAAEARCERLHPRLVLSFPANIARLRSAYEKLSAQQQAQSGGGGGEASPTSLPQTDTGLSLSLDEAQQSRDALPSYSSITRNSDDLVLQNILSTISHQRIRYVGLVATDTVDLLFLAERIRQYCPDVRLFTFGNDILFTNPKYSSYFEGMIVASPYPLFSLGLMRSAHGAPAAVNQFPSSASEGTYNAAALLLSAAGHPVALNDYYTPGGALNRPPIWLSIVSNGAMWPLTYLPTGDADDDYIAAAPAPARQTEITAETLVPSKLWSMIFFLVAVFCAACCAGFLVVREGAPPERRGGFWSRLAAECRKYFGVFEAPRHHPLVHRWAVALFFFGLLAVFMLLGAVAAIPTQMEVTGFAMVARSVGQLALGTTALALFITPILVSLFNLRWRQTLGFAFLGVAVMTFLLVPLTSDLAERRQQIALFYQRATDFSSGLSPVMPFLLVGGALCGAMMVVLGWLRRLELWPKNPISAPAVRDAEIRLRALLRVPLRRPRLSAIVVLLASFPIYQVVVKPILMIEGRYIEGFWGGLGFMLALSSAWILIVTFFVWFLYTSVELRRFLRRLAAHPLAPAYDRMPHEFSKTIAQLASSAPLLSELGVLVEQVRLLANHALKLPDADALALLGPLTRTGTAERGRALLSRFAERVERTFAAEVSRSTDASERLDARRSPTQELLCAISERLARVLDKSWARRPLAPVTLDGGEPNTPTGERYAQAAPAETGAWLRLCEDYVATHVVIYLCHVFTYLRLFIGYVTVAILLLLLSVISYPFQPQRMLMLLAWSLMGGVTVGSVIVFVQLERDEVLSRISKTKPGKISWERSSFVSHILIYVALPLLGLIAAEFPSVGKVLFSWVGPALRILH